jgi:hypothetical protein
VYARQTLFRFPIDTPLPPIPVRVNFDAEMKASLDAIK